MMPHCAAASGASSRMRFSSSSRPSSWRISPRRTRLLWATIVPSGMVTATNIMSGLAAISSSRTCRRTPASLRMPERRMLSKAMISEEPFSASRRAIAASLRSMEMKASSPTIRASTTAAPPSTRPRGVREAPTRMARARGGASGAGASPPPGTAPGAPGADRTSSCSAFIFRL